MFDDPQKLATFFARANAVVRPLLQSPLHTVVSGRTPIKDAEAKADLLSEFARRNGPKAAKGLMLGLPGDRQPNRQELLDAAAKTTIVRLSLTPADF